MLRRNISLTTGIAIAVSMVIGSGLFALPGLAIEASDPITALLGWLTVIVLMPPMIYIFSFLGRRFPLAGGITLYASKAFGRWSEAGFSLVICGALAVGMPAFFMVGGAYLAELLNLDPDRWFIPLAIVLALSSTLMNIAGVDRLGWVNKFVVVSVLALVIMIVVLALPNFTAGAEQLTREIVHVELDISSIWLVATIVFWAFQGWENMSFGLEEFDDPQRSIPIVFWSSFVFISIIYAVFALAATLASLAGEEVVGLSGLTTLMGSGAQKYLILILTVLVLAANANSWVFGASRAFYSAANQGVMPKSLGKLNRRQLPLISLLATLTLYIAVMLGMWVFDVHPKYAFLLTTQGFIILYGASILAFYKLTSGYISRVIACAALFSWLFLMHGFGWLIIYPLALFVIGVIFKRYASQAELMPISEEQ